VTGPSLPLVFVRGERAVCHVIDASLPAGEISRAVELYFAPDVSPSGVPLWRSSSGDRPLDPAVAIGAQVPADAEIVFASPPG